MCLLDWPIIFTLYIDNNTLQVLSKAFRTYILITKTTAAQNEVALSYHKLRGLYFLAIIFAATIIRTLEILPGNKSSIFFAA